ncbi:MAG: ATP-dependent RecD-like DNA helicase [Clostridia bacterium]|nr:ATP-dependent RecD-like DNA helicase [Clostridia bacterium]
MPDGKDLVSVEGEVEDVVFQSDETGYTVCTVDCDGEPVTLVGILPQVMVGDTLRAMGRWTEHPTYGKQFKVEYFEKQMPADAGSMLRYLSSRSVKGVGPVLARRIVDRFGESTFDVLENNPDLLTDVAGISPRKARQISEAFREQFGVRNIMMFFGSYFGTTTSVRIYKRWGSAAIDVVKKNPYLLCDEIYGVSFEKADAMAESLGISRDSDERVRAGFHYVLRYNASYNGHCYLPREKLMDATVELLGVEKKQAQVVLEGLCRTADLICNRSRENRPVYLPEYFTAETSVASRMAELSRIHLFGSVADLEELIDRTQITEGLVYSPAQRKAIRGAVEHPVSLLTGGPGTGKTTIIKAIVNIFSQVGMSIALCAPTGRAAKRVSLSTGCDAKTVHRLLEMEYSPDDRVKFAKNEKNPLKEDVIIVDEVSMVDVLLFSSLLKAIRPGARLVLIGDSDQLPSVGAGQVLHDTLESGVFNVSTLDRIYRQKKESFIVENAHRINRGEMPVSSGKDGDFFIMPRTSTASAAQTVVSLCRERLPASYGKEVLEGVQVISCTRKGELGTAHLNVLLQEALNPPHPSKNEKKFGTVTFCEEDKVMQVRNNYDLEWQSESDPDEGGFGIFNGDIGIIRSIDPTDETVSVSYDGKLVTYSFSDLSEFEHAFAVTVHKSQGSEYPIVIFPVYRPPLMLATRNLIYTAVTRAKKMVILVGEPASVQRMIDNDQKSLRYTDLSQMYREFLEK